MENPTIDNDFIFDYIESSIKNNPELKGDFASILDQGSQIYLEKSEGTRSFSKEEIKSLINNIGWMTQFYNAWVDIWVKTQNDSPENCMSQFPLNQLIVYLNY